MKSRTIIPLRVIIPGLTLIFSMLFGGILMLRELQDSEQRMTKELRRYATARSTTIAGMLQYLLRHNNHRGAELFVSFVSSDVNVQSVIICNADNKIIYSNRYDFRNRPLEEVATPDMITQVTQARNSLSTQCYEEGENHLYSTSSFLMPPAEGEIRPTSVGCVLLDLDLKMIRAGRRSDTYQRWAELAGLLLAFCGTIWVVLHITLGKRVRRLARAADQIGEGDLDITIRVKGYDEVAYLARSLESMAADLKVNRNKLKAAYDEMEGRVKLRTADLESARRKAYSLMQDANSQREKAEQALARLSESQNELRTLSRAIEQSPAEVMITEADGRISYVNPAFTKISGYSAEEAIGQTPSFLSARIQPDKEYDELWESIMAGNQWCGEFCNQKKDGSIYWEMASISPVRDEQDMITHFVAVKEDVTAQKRVAEELAEAKKSAESASQAKSAFLANMSHEIRTPMNIIIGMSHLALDTKLSGKQHDYIQKISGAAHSLLGIINDILDFSKIEAGKLTLEERPFKLDDIITNVTGLMNVRLGQKDLELLIDVDRNIPLQLRGDSLRLTQILNNLLSNAIKFTEKGEVQLSAKLVEEAQDRIGLDFCVRDSGIGMSDELLKNLFKSFTQADSSTTRKYGGTGLGLAICQQLCKLMNGWIYAESELGKGSAFHFHLPFGTVRGQHVRTAFQPTDDLKNMPVLVVDDNHAVRKLIQKFLCSMGFRADAVPGGKEALRRLEQRADDGEAYRLVVLDWNMPNMDGIETGRKIRSLELPHQPKLLMLTAYGHDEVLHMAEEAGFNGFLLKPVQASLLFNHIMNIFGKASRIEPSARHALKAHATGSRILLVEDHEINQQMAVELLEKIGMHVTVAGNGKEAVERVFEHHFDLVLMDIQMPVMDGLTATRTIRNSTSPKTAGLPILAMTAHAMTGDREKSLAAGMNGHITKPIDPDEIIKALNQWLPKTATHPAPSAPSDCADRAPRISGLETVKALQRLGGNRSLYQDLLLQFVEASQDTGIRLCAAMKRGDRNEATRIAHTIKGVAANLGALQLQTQATELESLLRNNSPAIEIPLQQFQTTLQHTIESIKTAQPTKPGGDPLPGTPGDLTQLRHQLKALQTPLQNRTPQPCKSIMSELSNKQWPAALAIEIKNLNALISKYRFDEARAALSKIMLSINETEPDTGEPHGT